MVVFENIFRDHDRWYYPGDQALQFWIGKSVYDGGQSRYIPFQNGVEFCGKFPVTS
ncbi:MAG: hypothetical protein RIQ56_666, partial [Candidatus Parcubacteria bacterium]